jgi:hypothetical protein
MNYKSIILLGFAVAAIGIFIIPSTLSMFVGQHQWYSVRTAESQYDLCERCHAAEVGEWQANRDRGGAHASYENEGNPDNDPGCFCHQVNDTRLDEYGIDTSNIDAIGFEIFNETGSLDGSPAAFNTAWRTNSTPHAAITIACVDCHLNASSQLNHTNEAHGVLYNASLVAATSVDVSENTACLACHTMVGLNITMKRMESGITIIANHTNYTGEGWSLDISINRSSRTNDSTYWAPNQSS